ncbi:MAG TPA: hypothetical protein VLF62_05160 [Candidatus Saccharimonadales bacterium]|nr:hypothetical protein [Candidatus Saccharimonadales bacterium]
MIRPDFESSGASFNEDAPILTPEQIIEKRRAWLAGETVRSEIVAIGHVSLRGDERWLLDRLYDRNFGRIDPNSDPGRAFGHMQAAVHDMAEYDMSRGSNAELPAESLMHGGYFRRREDIAPWHTNRDPQATVLYTVVHGAGPTRGLTGDMSRDDILLEPATSMGYFKEETPIGPGQRLEPTDFTEGTVLRYTIDGHASGDTQGARLLTQAKIILPQA